jgi:hypothetical protein
VRLRLPRVSLPCHSNGVGGNRQCWHKKEAYYNPGHGR